MYKAVAAQLGNTVAVCKKYYVHPTVVALYERGKLRAWLARHDVQPEAITREAAERALLTLPRRV